MPDIKVSVIMPVYNAERFLQDTVQSVLKQTLREIELICVDDGSTDGSLYLLEEMSEKDSRIRVLHQQNQFAGMARNAGLKEASGKYVVFWDSDDRFDQEALALMYEACEKDQAQICICGADKYDEKQDFRYPTDEYLVWRRVPEKRPFNRRDIGKYLYNFASNVPWNKMFLRSFVQESGLEFQGLRQANDVYFVMLALFYADRITAVHKSLVTYRIANENSVTGRAKDATYCTAQALEAVYDRLEQEADFTKPLRQSFANKTIGPLMNVLRLQADAASAKELYEYYKTELMPKFGLFGQDPSFFHNPVDYETTSQIQSLSYEDFILYYARSFSARYRLEEGRRRDAQMKEASLKKVQRENEWIKQSLPYRLGNAIAYVPRKVRGLGRKKNRG